MNNRYVVPMGSIASPSYLDITIKSAEDSYVIGENGKTYLDLRSGLWNTSLGYNKKLYKEVIDAFSNVLSLGIPYLDIHSYNHPLYNDYASKLLSFMNDDRKTDVFSKIFYTNSGSEGTELAVKLVDHLKTNNQSKILAFNEGYHGTFFAGMSISGLDQKITSDYRLPLGVSFIESPTTPNKMMEIIKVINERSDIAAFVIEPVIGSSGTIIMNKDYIEEIISTCKKNNVLVIFDEVATGFYKTGNRFYYSQLSQRPDIVILSKGINNGILPFGVVVINPEIEKRLGNTHIEHFSTQNGNILGITSALKTLEYYLLNENLIQENIFNITNASTEILELKEISYRLLGAMLSIEINDSSKTIELVQYLSNIGILIYHYDNLEGQSGLTLFPPFFVDLNKYKKVLKIIANKVVY